MINPFILGILMGNGCIIVPKKGNPYLRIFEAKEIKWLEYKRFLVRGTREIQKTGKRWVWMSNADQAWAEYHDLIYKNGRKHLTMDILNRLTAESLAVWFLDKGFFKAKSRIGLRTTAFNNNLLYQYFTEVNIPCQIYPEKNTGRVVFTKEGTQNFVSVIQQNIEPFMLHRLVH